MINERDLTDWLQQALAAHQAGDLSTATQGYHRVLQQDPNQAEAWHYLGLVAYQEQRPTQAIELMGKALALRPSEALFHYNQGKAYQQAADLAAAIAAYQQAIRLAPQQWEIQRSLALALRLNQQYDQAIQQYQTLLAHMPQDAKLHQGLIDTLLAADQLSAAQQHCQQLVTQVPGWLPGWLTLGGLWLQQQAWSAAQSCWEKALSLAPQHPQAWLGLALSLQGQHQWEPARHAYLQALQAQPDLAEAWRHLGEVYHALGQWEEAEQAFTEALTLQPNDALLWNNLGSAHQQQRQLSAAILAYQQALAQEPTLSIAWRNLGMVYQLNGEPEEARRCYQEVHHLTPNDTGISFKQALCLPLIYQSLADIHHWRGLLTEQLEALASVEHPITDPYTEVGMTAFYLPYQGLADDTIQRLLTQRLRAACPTLTYQAPHCQHPHHGGKIRVGLLSRHWNRHTVHKLFGGIVTHLNRELFEVTLLHFSATPRDEWEARLMHAADHQMALPLDFFAARDQIATLKLDVLLYPDIGLEAMGYYLAFARLAPLQLVTWGHGITTGLTSLDGFISSIDLETPGNADFYSEPLVTLPHLLPCYTFPEVIPPGNIREQFNLSRTANLYGCLQSPFKLHPDFDDVLGRILRQDRRGILLLLQGEGHMQALLEQRLQRTIPDVLSQVRFIPPLATPDFMRLQAAADVLLDPLHFGGGNTTYEALATGTPVITLPTRWLKGRITTALYQQMDWTDLVTSSTSEYVVTALALAQDKALQQTTRKTIQDARGILYNNPQGIRDLEAYVLQQWHARH